MIEHIFEYSNAVHSKLIHLVNRQTHVIGLVGLLHLYSRFPFPDLKVRKSAAIIVEPGSCQFQEGLCVDISQEIFSQSVRISETDGLSN